MFPSFACFLGIFAVAGIFDKVITSYILVRLRSNLVTVLLDPSVNFAVIQVRLECMISIEHEC